MLRYLRGDQGGWPVVAFAHGTIGIEKNCGPSISPDLFTHRRYVKVLTKLGYAVALADYQGLGVKGIHPHIDSPTAGLNMIDAVRALRRTFPGVSDRWVAVEDSQRGGAAWAADEQAGRSALLERVVVGLHSGLVASPARRDEGDRSEGLHPEDTGGGRARAGRRAQPARCGMADRFAGKAPQNDC
jgi:hypothetical protein